MSFVELHARSAFSFLRGSSHPEALIERAAQVGMSQVALCDFNGFYGTARAHHKAGEVEIRAIVGSELTMADGTSFPILVLNRTGYQNLARLLTRAQLRSPKGECPIQWQELEEFSEGLFALSGDRDGGLLGLVTNEDREKPVQLLDRLKGIFGSERLAIEVQRHCERTEDIGIRLALELADRFKLPVVASNGPCYADKGERCLLDAFTALRHHCTLDEAGRALAVNSQRYLKGEGEMRALFPDMPHAIDETCRIADMVEFTLEDLGYEFPTYPVPAGHNQDSFLREQTMIGARRRYGTVSAKTKRQIIKELRLVEKLGFGGYFLTVWGIVEFCREKGILVQGRGSAANSTVCYCLGITNADPNVYHLLFERFLSEGRKGWPDIDLDLPSGERRESVIQEVYRRFAPYGAAMTANVITYRGRSAMREMGKVLDIPIDVVARFSALFSHGDFPHTIDLKDQVKQSGLAETHPRLPALLMLYKAVYGMPRHLGQHSGGMVLCPNGLDSIVPLEPASMPGRVVVQWDKDDCEDLGIIKVDLLGLGMMAALQDTIHLCNSRGPERAIDLHRVPPDDPKTYEMIQRADTIGVFQIESRAQMATLPRLLPKVFYDLVISVAIIRPGPIVGKMVHPYLNRRAGKEKPDYMDDRLKSVLERTLGVPLFQEQVLEIAMVIGGFTGTEAEELRRALSYHRSQERMDKVMAKLYAAMDLRGVRKDIQERIVKNVSSFAVYGFPQSHAISFALLAYASAWLRAHRFAEFTVALLNNQPMGFCSSSTLVRDAKLHGLRILPVCVAESDSICTVVNDQTIRLGLNQLRGFRAVSASSLIDERNLKPWDDLQDFLERTKLPKDARRLLAQAGALNKLSEHRRSALWDVEVYHGEDLFSGLKDEQPSPLAMMTPAERMATDYASTGLTIGRHPMALQRDSLPDVTLAAEVPYLRRGQRIIIAGLVICRQRPGTASGHVFISLEDETGISNAFVPSKLFEANRLVITQERFLKISGRLQIVDNVATVYSEKVEPMINIAIGPSSHDFH